MAIKENFRVPSSNGRSCLHGVIWKPEGEVRMVLQVAHGMLEHIEYYGDFACWLADRGIAVAGHDHLGHGRTAAGPEEFGFFAEKDGYVYLVKDLNRVRRYLTAQFPDLPYFLMGHSMGSFMVRRYLTAFGDGLSGAILMGTGHQPLAQVQLGLALAGMASVFLGEDYRSGLVQKLFQGAMNQRLRPTRTAMDWLSTDEEQVDRFVSDYYCDYLFTCSAYRDLLRMVSDAEDPRLLQRVPKELSLLLISGSEDPVGEYGKGVERACKAYRRAGVQNVELLLYPECRHELVIEKNRLQAAADTLHWMEKQLKQED